MVVLVEMALTVATVKTQFFLQLFLLVEVVVEVVTQVLFLVALVVLVVVDPMQVLEPQELPTKDLLEVVAKM
jgi:hypothetical protein